MSEKNLSDLENTLNELQEKLFLLREKGELKVADIKTEIDRIKKNKFLTSSERQSKLDELLPALESASNEVAKNKDEVRQLQQQALAVSKEFYSQKIATVKQEQNSKIEEYKAERQRAILEVNREYQTMRETNGNDKQAKLHKSSKLFEIENKTRSNIFQAKSEKSKAYLEEVQTNIDLRNGKTNILENWNLQIHDYFYKFKMSTFLLANGLYLAILIFFIFCIIIAPLQGNGQLLSLPNIFTILEQSSTRMFYALGVAGLILLAGTDLSVGRMVALGAVVTGLILHPGVNIVTFLGMGPWDFTGLPMAVRLLFALCTSVVLCVAFSAFAGVFSAKLKIHPFISTLSTQLIIYGLLFFGTRGTPVGSIDNGIKDLLGGRWTLGVINGELITFPKLIVPAAIAIAVASVSGISVFRVTMGVFIMAGVFYEIGAFLEAFRANASAGTGQGYELDAIAACVVGGISFNGGIGKISGAVIGVIIFTGLTYCLTFLGIDTNLQFVFKGLISIAAVALDSIKYLQKK